MDDPLLQILQYPIPNTFKLAFAGLCFKITAILCKMVKNIAFDTGDLVVQIYLFDINVIIYVSVCICFDT